MGTLPATCCVALLLLHNLSQPRFLGLYSGYMKDISQVYSEAQQDSRCKWAQQALQQPAPFPW